MNNNRLKESDVKIMCKKIQSNEDEIFYKKKVIPAKPKNEMKYSLLTKKTKKNKLFEYGKFHFSSIRSRKKDKLVKYSTSKSYSFSCMPWNKFLHFTSNSFHNYDVAQRDKTNKKVDSLHLQFQDTKRNRNKSFQSTPNTTMSNYCTNFSVQRKNNFFNFRNGYHHNRMASLNQSNYESNYN